MRLPTLARHYFRARDGARLAYYVAGRQGAPPLVITAGLGGGVRAWTQIIALLMDRFRIYAWDYRGLYASVSDPPPPSHKLTIDNHALDLIDLIDHLGLRRHLTPLLAGWSMGVQVTFEAVRRQPNLARAVVALHGSPGGILSTAFNSGTFERISPHLFGVFKRHHLRLRGPAHWFARSRRVAMAFMDACHRLGMMNPDADPDVFHDMARDWVRLDLATYAVIFEHLGAHDVRAFLPRFPVSTLVVGGGADLFTPLYLSEDIARLIPSSHLVVIDSATHFGPLEHPAAIADAILTFARRTGVLSVTAT